MALNKNHHSSRLQASVGALLLGQGLVVMSTCFFNQSFFSVSIALFACLYFVLAGIVFFKWHLLAAPIKWGMSFLGLRVFFGFIVLLMNSLLRFISDLGVDFSVWVSVQLFIKHVFSFPFYSPQYKRIVEGGYEGFYLELHFIYLETLLSGKKVGNPRTRGKI